MALEREYGTSGDCCGAVSCAELSFSPRSRVSGRGGGGGEGGGGCTTAAAPTSSACMCCSVLGAGCSGVGSCLSVSAFCSCSRHRGQRQYSHVLFKRLMVSYNRVCLHVCMHVCAGWCACAYEYTHDYTHIRIYVQRKHEHAHTNTHTYTHTHTHTDHALQLDLWELLPQR